VLLEEVLPTSRFVSGFTVTHNFEKIGRRTMLVSGRRIEDISGAGSAMILLAIEDVSDRMFAEETLLRTEKLAIAGKLAATLAHEINNPLQAVTNLMSLLGQSPRLNDQDQRFANMAATELNRVSNLTRQSLRFYKEASSPATVNLDETLDEVLALYAKEIEAKNCKVNKQYLSHRQINSYPGDIRQVVTILLLNALEASEPGCTITLRVRDSVHQKKARTPGIRIVVADSGVGIPVQNRLHIFEPFFTTKGEHGTGLGLWVASVIVSRLGGSIQLRSSVHPGKSGTCFSIFLPDQVPSLHRP
jgi:two-component system CheB/CheR fusion protein